MADVCVRVLHDATAGHSHLGPRVHVGRCRRPPGNVAAREELGLSIPQRTTLAPLVRPMDLGDVARCSSYLSITAFRRGGIL